MRDQRRSGRQNRRGAAVIRFQPDDRRTREILLEAQDVFHFRTAPGIDALIVVADAADIAVRLREQTEPEILHQIGVLVLVHQNVPPGLLVAGEHVRLLAQELG